MNFQEMEKNLEKQRLGNEIINIMRKNKVREETAVKITLVPKKIFRDIRTKEWARIELEKLEFILKRLEQAF